MTYEFFEKLLRVNVFQIQSNFLCKSHHRQVQLSGTTPVTHLQMRAIYFQKLQTMEKNCDKKVTPFFKRI